MRKVILDTDIGDDIDDLFALDFLAHSPEVKIVGVTTVFRNSVARAKMAKYALRLWGLGEVPACAGADHPLVYDTSKLIHPMLRAKEQYDQDGNFLPCQYVDEMSGEGIEQKNAVELIAQLAQRYGKDLYIFAIGPLTNIALAIRTYPKIMQGIGGISLMGGLFYSPEPEWNIKADPEAAHVVFSSGIPVRAVGCDVVKETGFSKEELQGFPIANSAGRQFLLRMTDLWHERYKRRLIMHDVLALMGELFEGIVFYREEKVEIVLHGDGNERGKTVLSEGGAPVQIAYKIDADKFMKLFKERL